MYIYWGEFAAFWGNFMYFWGILGDFQAETFWVFFLLKLGFVRGFFSV
jgi:hypothetical protein